MAIPVKFTQGDTVEQRLASTETTLRHFSRRLQKTGIVTIPPIPIFARADVSGLVFRGLIPYKGQLNIAAVWIGKFIERPVIATFKLSNTGGEVSIAVTCEQRHTIRDLGLELLVPSILEIEVIGAEDILVSVLTEIEYSKTRREMMLLDEILSSYEASEDLEEQ